MAMTTATSTDRIEKQLILDAPRSRVWRALTDVTQFNRWFGVTLTRAFAPGAEVSGKLSIRNYEHVTLRIWIEQMEPERFFSFRWHPYALEAGVDYSAEPTTLVTFTLEELPEGTRLAIVESGFDAIPAARRAQAFSMNEKGWTGQAENIRKFVAAQAQQSAPPLYGVRQLVDGTRAVRQNTILMAEDIPEASFGHRATPGTRSVAETLVHIAWLGSADRLMHEELHLDSLEGFDFAALLARSAADEKRPRSKAEILTLLRDEGARWASWVESLPNEVLAQRVALPGGGSVSRFEMLLGTKEHELQHRAQLTVLQRLMGIAPRFTGLA
jgi:uncharacterized protein YndB with AHSA1/START domain/uncharacterized damage-inducible protein DinB